MFENASCDFVGNTLCLKLQDSIVAEGKKDAIAGLLDEVFNDRFHVPVSIQVSYLPKKKKSALKYNELQLQAEVDQIVARNEELRKEKMKKEETGDTGKAENEPKKEEAPKRRRNALIKDRRNRFSVTISANRMIRI